MREYNKCHCGLDCDINSIDCRGQVQAIAEVNIGDGEGNDNWVWIHRCAVHAKEYWTEN